MSKNIIKEAIGTWVTATNQQQQQNIPQQIEPSWVKTSNKTDPEGFIFKYCHQLRPEQQKILNLLRNNNDVYISMGAGGGKTMPAMCYWLNEVLGLNVILDRNININQINQSHETVRKLLVGEIENLPKLLWLVPTKTLANEAFEEFRDSLSNILIQYITKIIDPNIINFNERDPNFLNYINRILTDYRNIFPNDQNLANILQQLRTHINNHQNFINSYGLEDYQRLKDNFFNVLKQHIIKKIKNVLDIKLVSQKTGEGVIGAKTDKALVIVSIIQSAPSIIKNIKNLKMILVDESHLTQNSNINIEDTQAESIANGLYIVFNFIKGNNNIRLLFLTGTVHPDSAKNFINFVNKCFKRNLKLLDLPGKNPSVIEVVEDNSLQFETKLIEKIKKLINTKDYGNLVILYSVNKIGKLAEKLLKELGLRSLDTKSPFDIYHKRNERNKNILFSDEDLKQPVTSSDAGKIKNPLLRQCVQKGFGFIYGKKDDIYGEINQEDKRIVLSLFSQKKISVIIATDAVGVGLNISAKSMYIPENEKTTSVYDISGNNTMRKQAVPIRDLVQIINRLGRSTFSLSTVYTPKEYIDDVILAINSTPESFVKVDAIKYLGCEFKFFSSLYLNTIKTLINLFKEFKRS